jgi:hypothetical protein
VIRTKYIGLIPVENRFPLNFIKDENGPQYKVSPYFFYPENPFKPVTTEQKEEKREKKEECDDGIDKKERAPYPLQGIKNIFDGLFQCVNYRTAKLAN